MGGRVEIRWSGLTILYFDCFSGASGDMILGALLDAGLPLDDLRGALGSLAVDREMVWTERVRRAGLVATKLHVRGEEHRHASGDSHRHASEESHRHTSERSHRHESGSHRHASEISHPHAHRTLSEIGALIDESALSHSGKARAKALFQRLGEVEAAMHGTTIERVHLHEVGALDSIIDIAGAVYGLEALGVDMVVASPLNVGGGTVRSAHGVYPVPAPATVRLLEGAPIYAGPQQAELVTPTGALLVAGYAERYGPVPAMRLTTVGYGAGSRDFADTPNVLRVLIGEADAKGPSHTVVVMEAEIDDMNPQIFGVLMDRLLAEGALDVFYTAVQMKKSRPGTLLTIVAPPEERERLASVVFRETTTIGVRYREMLRECLDRETVTVETPFGAVGIKVARRHGEVLNASPEFDDCARLAEAAGAPVKDVQAAAMRAYLDRT
ncbi:MAG: nickel pincer cofactor biosynthesis protein LarC [Acidobacteria bacterium]|nr:nickel pincer cofactor biosynthesis protein LarC [Acidobacteriota bacterium]